MQDILLFIQQHWLLNAGLAAILFILIFLEFLNQKRNAAKVTPAQVTHLINRSNANIIDIRNSDLFKEGHIIGALSIPVAELPEKIKKLEKLKSQPLVITCMTGVESARAAGLLMQKGFNVHVLAGGIRAWNEADMPLVKE
jgi:rhodanese-related sulfurtransferase